MLKIKPEIWTKNGRDQFVVLSLSDFEKIQESIEDAGLSRILREAKRRESGAKAVTMAEMKRRLGISQGPTRAGGARRFGPRHEFLSENNADRLLTARQPFGGFGLPGVGAKAGGRDYLLQFTDPRVVTENTMRRGFAPGRT